MSELQVHIPAGAIREPDNAQYDHRFKIRSATSASLYLISRHIASNCWCCSCRGYIIHRYCKHLKGIGIPEKLAYQREQMQLKKQLR